MAVEIPTLIGAFTSTLATMKCDQTDQIRARIRELRRARGLTLLDCEVLSCGRIKAIVLGAYERGERAMSLKKVIEIAELFDIALIHLIGPVGPHEKASMRTGRHIYDLRALRTLAPSSEKSVLSRYLSLIAEQRGDWAGEVISLRDDDVQAIARLLDSEEIDFRRWVIEQEISLVKR
jgi:transcriptional regulator with XRE-family HTH domain